MANQIEIHDANLLRRVESVVDDLRKYYPDGVVKCIDAQHKGLSNRIGELWPLAGYASRKDFFKAYGFTSESSGKGGRAPTLDPERIFAELTSRYENREKPTSLCALIDENPDLKGPLKSMSNESSARFGRSFAKELKRRGLLSNKRPVDAPDQLDRAKAEAAIDELGLLLCDMPNGDKPHSFGSLEVRFPAQAAVIKTNKVDKKRLQLLGILTPSREQIKKDSIRGTSLERLSQDLALLGEYGCIQPGDERARLLPTHILGIDIENKVELRDALVAVENNKPFDFYQGDAFPMRIVTRQNMQDITQRFIVVGPHKIQITKNMLPLFDLTASRVSEKLNEHTGVMVKNVQEYEGCYLAQLECRYLADLRTETLANILCALGVVTDIDKAGGMGWRFRMQRAACDKGSFDALRPEESPYSEQPVVEPVGELNVSDTDVSLQENEEAKEPIESRGHAEQDTNEGDGGFFPTPNFVLGLLAEDYLYFPDDSIAWNGAHHEIHNVDFNGTRIDGLMDRVRSAWCSDMDDAKEVANNLITLLNEIEHDEALHVPKQLIESSIRGPVCDGMNAGAGGDLTGITLANLAAMGGAIRLGDKVARDEYALLYDARLARGIPQFFNLMARLLWDLRACSRTLGGKPFTVRFMGARNIDADEYLGCDNGFDAVPGAQECPGEMRVTSAPEITLPSKGKQAKKAAAKVGATKPKAEKASEAKDAKVQEAKAAKPTKARKSSSKASAQSADQGKAAAASGDGKAQPKAKGRLVNLASETFCFEANERLRSMASQRASADYFIATSEMVAHKIMDGMQSEADSATAGTSGWSEDKYLLAEVMGKYVAIATRYLGYFVDALEAQIDLGTSRTEVLKMAAEAEEFTELADKSTLNINGNVLSVGVQLEFSGECDKLKARIAAVKSGEYVGQEEKPAAAKAAKPATAAKKKAATKVQPAGDKAPAVEKSAGTKVKATKAKPAKTVADKAKAPDDKVRPADEAGAAKPAKSAAGKASKAKDAGKSAGAEKSKSAKPAKPAAKTFDQVLDEIHESVQAAIQHGAPAVNEADTMRKVRAAMVAAGGSGSMFDDSIRELDRQFHSGQTPPRALGQGELAGDTTLGRAVDMLRANGGGVKKEAVSSALGAEALSAALSDPAVVEEGGKLYLWCQRDFAGKPIRDYRQALLSLEENVAQAESAYRACRPFNEARLHEIEEAHADAVRQLNNAGFFAFNKKKELKARIEALNAEAESFKKSQEALSAVDAAKAKLAKMGKDARRELKARGLL